MCLWILSERNTMVPSTWVTIRNPSKAWRCGGGGGRREREREKERERKKREREEGEGGMKEKREMVVCNQWYQTPQYTCNNPYSAAVVKTWMIQGLLYISLCHSYIYTYSNTHRDKSYTSYNMYIYIPHSWDPVASQAETALASYQKQSFSSQSPSAFHYRSSAAAHWPLPLRPLSLRCFPPPWSLDERNRGRDEDESCSPTGRRLP